MKKRPDEFTRFVDSVRYDYYFQSFRSHKYKYGGYFKVFYYENKLRLKKL